MEQFGMMPIIILIFGSSLLASLTDVNPLMIVLGSALEFVFWIVEPILWPVLEPSL